MTSPRILYATESVKVTSWNIWVHIYFRPKHSCWPLESGLLVENCLQTGLQHLHACIVHLIPGSISYITLALNKIDELCSTRASKWCKFLWKYIRANTAETVLSALEYMQKCKTKELNTRISDINLPMCVWSMWLRGEWDWWNVIH